MTDTKALTLVPQLSAQSDPKQMVETYADRLMDELFDGVERALAGDADALEKPAQPQAEVLETPAENPTLNFSDGGLPAILLSDHASLVAPLDLPLSLKTAAPDPEPAVPDTRAGWRRHWTLNRALLGAAGVSLLATLALWFHQRQQVPVVVSVPAPNTAEVPTVDTQVEFLEYLRRSLNVISQQVSESAAVPGTTGVPEVSVALNPGALGLPPVPNTALPTPGGLPAAAGSINVIERVYIPYQAPQAPTAGTSVPYQTAPAPASAGPPVATPAPIHTLVGVLELGDRSAALFEIDGVPQRVYIGERIGNSGWSLVSVGNDEAVIRRNGEVRSIYIGQQF